MPKLCQGPSKGKQAHIHRRHGRKQSRKHSSNSRIYDAFMTDRTGAKSDEHDGAVKDLEDDAVIKVIVGHDKQIKGIRRHACASERVGLRRVSSG